MENDVSFLVGGTMNLYEHQSTFNPNMPLRGVFYFSRLYEGYVADNNLMIYPASKAEIYCLLQWYKKPARFHGVKAFRLL